MSLFVWLMPRLCFVMLDILLGGTEETEEWDDDNMDMFDTDGTRGRLKGTRPGTLRGEEMG